MADNAYVNRVDYGGNTLIDISDTTATEADVLAGKSFYLRSGQPAIGTLAGIPYGQVDSTSTSTVFTATISGITELKDGVIMALRNNVVTSASNFTININGLGAKPVYSNMGTGSSPTRETTGFNIAYTMLFIYSSNLVSGGAWINYRGYDANTNTIGYQLRTNSTVKPVSDTARYYKLYFTSAD